MVGGVKSHLESNPTHARDAQSTHTEMFRVPKETETELCLGVS